MVPRPLLDVYVVWHPYDPIGQDVANWVVEHFHSAPYAGLAGTAVETYVRSAPWGEPGSPPRPLPFQEARFRSAAAEITVVIPVLGAGLVQAVGRDERWLDYVRCLFEAETQPVRDGAVPVPAVTILPIGVVSGGYGRLESLLGKRQLLSICSAAPMPCDVSTPAESLVRDIVQTIVQRFTPGGPDGRVTVFISHTKWHGDDLRPGGEALVALVRDILVGETRLGTFFDANNIQIGEDFSQVLVEQASHCALLMIRTDLYATREWTQREVLAAKRNDVPIVALHAVRAGEDRGSFVMDHVPVVACPAADGERAVRVALLRLMDEALKRLLWQRQRVYRREAGFDWMPSRAPEPVTLIPWLEKHRRGGPDRRVLILHPDPPLAAPEHEILVELCALAGFDQTVDIVTPRTFAARGGSVDAVDLQAVP